MQNKTDCMLACSNMQTLGSQLLLQYVVPTKTRFDCFTGSSFLYDKGNMEYRLEKGRPADCSGRLDKEIRTYDLLDSLGVQYERIDHEAVMTIDACAEVDKVLAEGTEGTEVCKNLFLCNRQETVFYMLMLPGAKKFNTKEVSAQLGVARLSFAKENYMEEFLDITPGSVSVMGLMNDKDNHVQLLIDEDLLKHEFFGCHPCINTSSLRIAVRDLTDKILPAVHHKPIIIHL